jgi:hypothetical protein
MVTKGCFVDAHLGLSSDIEGKSLANSQIFNGLILGHIP